MQTTHHAHANFKRKEKKYVLNQGEYLALMGLIGEKLEEDEYAYSHIESLYYDTPDWRMINRSMEKPLYKEKLRVRVYGTMGETQSTDPDQVAFVELKKKFKGIVYKRRMVMSLQGALAFMDGMDYEEAMAAYPATSKDLELGATWRDRQIAAEIRACIDRWQPLAPAMIIAVDRMSLRTNDGSGVRMTFDFDSRWRTQPLGFGEAEGEQLMPNNEIILEIKAQGAYPLWLVHALDQAKIYPVSNTKYGRAYRAAFPSQPALTHAPQASELRDFGARDESTVAAATTTATAASTPTTATATSTAVASKDINKAVA